nr:MAG: replication initiator protein [Microviridae sp.]
MPCFSPLLARYRVDSAGKKQITFDAKDAQKFYLDNGIPRREDYFLSSHDFNSLNRVYSLEQLARPFPIQLPCSNCIGCRLERSRQWALRCMHEASLYEDNCFVTLTFSPEGLASQCPTGSLDRRHMQLFMKRLRKYFSGASIRYFLAGEYGEKNFRPHYHLCLFNCDFSDKTYWKSQNEHNYYVSDILREIWPYGFNVIGDLTFDSAAYVARYCLKKVNGDASSAHYSRVNGETGELIQLLPEFCQASLKPGIGAGWFDQFAMSDVYPFDEVVVNGARSKPPRYYDKLLERVNPEMLLDVKFRRDLRRVEKEDDNVFSRLLVKQRCQEIRLGLLVRSMEAEA